MNTLIIARFTLHEAVRRRLILAGVLLSLAFVGLFALGFYLIYSRSPDSTEFATSAQARAGFGSVMTVLGLYAVYFLGSFLALFLSVGAVSGEIDSGALHAVLARPLRRAEFVAGRWLAYSGLVAVYITLMSGMLLLCARLISGYSVPDPARATALLALTAVALLSVSLFGSTVFPTLANGVVVFTLFGVAWLAGIIEFIGGALRNDAMLNIGTAVSLLMPSDAIWRSASFYLQSPLFLAALRTDDLGGIPFASSYPPAATLVLWALAYPIIFLVAAMLTFSRRDL